MKRENENIQNQNKNLNLNKEQETQASNQLKPQQPDTSVQQPLNQQQSQAQQQEQPLAGQQQQQPLAGQQQAQQPLAQEQESPLKQGPVSKSEPNLTSTIGKQGGLKQSQQDLGKVGSQTAQNQAGQAQAGSQVNQQPENEAKQNIAPKSRQGWVRDSNLGEGSDQQTENKQE